MTELAPRFLGPNQVHNLTSKAEARRGFLSDLKTLKVDRISDGLI